MKDLVFKNFKYWRGRAAAAAKHNKSDLEFCNEQKLRYLNKWLDLGYWSEADRENVIKLV